MISNYIVTAHRYGFENGHNYIVGSRPKLEAAEKLAKDTVEHRSGKYDCLVTEMRGGERHKYVCTYRGILCRDRVPGNGIGEDMSSYDNFMGKETFSLEVDAPVAGDEVKKVLQESGLLEILDKKFKEIKADDGESVFTHGNSIRLKVKPDLPQLIIERNRLLRHEKNIKSFINYTSSNIRKFRVLEAMAEAVKKGEDPAEYLEDLKRIETKYTNM